MYRQENAAIPDRAQLINSSIQASASYTTSVVKETVGGGAVSWDSLSHHVRLEVGAEDSRLGGWELMSARQ